MLQCVAGLHFATGLRDKTIEALQCVALCCSVLQCVALCCSVLQCGVVRDIAWQRVAVSSRAALCHKLVHQDCHDVSVCCSVLQCSVV